MTKGLVLEFTKMNGAGNDFVVIDNRFFHFSVNELSELAHRLCARRTGVGADGLLAFDDADNSDVDFTMTYVNADGSVAGMCGNGARCIAAFADETGLKKERLVFEINSTRYEAVVRPGQTGRQSSVRVFFPQANNLELAFSTVLTKDGTKFDLDYVDVGVPHAVWFGSDIATVPVTDWGREIRNHASFVEKDGTNVNFAEVVDATTGTHIKLRTYERGVEQETLACGSGAVSTFLVAHRRGFISVSECNIEVLGGTLRVGFTGNGSSVFLEGPAEFVFRGTVLLD